MSPDTKTPADASTPDLDALDSSWEGEAAEGDDVDDVDEGWETVPDPQGGPPIRRRVSPKERARQKREKHRIRAEAASKKQKGKKAKKRGADGRTLPPSAPPPAPGESSPEVAGIAGLESTTAADAPVAKRKKADERAPSPKGGVPRRRSLRLDARGIAMIALALAVAAAALYAMMASRR